MSVTITAYSQTRGTLQIKATMRNIMTTTNIIRSESVSFDLKNVEGGGVFAFVAYFFVFYFLACFKGTAGDCFFSYTDLGCIVSDVTGCCRWRMGDESGYFKGKPERSVTQQI